MSITQNAILEKKHSLHRAPPPKAPVNKPSSPMKSAVQNRGNDAPPITQLIPGIKLRKTGFRDSLIAEDIDNKNTANTDDGPTNELQSTLARMRAKFEHTEEPEEMKPKPKPKPKPRPSTENVKQQEDKESETKIHSGSCSDDSEESKNILTDSNKNLVRRDSMGQPKLCNLPTLESIGKPPPKCPKPDHLLRLLEKYDSNSIVMARRRNTLNRPINENSIDHSIAEEEDAGEEYDDVDEDLKAQILSRNEAEQEEQTATEEGIMEENYDDVDEMKEKVEEINNAAQNPEPICDESYDDLDAVAEQVLDQLQNDFAAGEETFGEEMYDAVGARLEEEEGNGEPASDSPVENKFSPSAIPSSPPKEKGRKDSKKEMENQKKKEREEQKRRKEEEKRREREEREEKKRKEEEKKKREQKDKELRKKHKLKPGAEGSGVGEAKSTFAGDGKFELPVKEGDTVVIISEKGCPQGKWLVKNSEGHLGYIPTELIQLKIDSEGNRMSSIITEDFYEDVDQYQGGGQIEEEDDQEVYDDIAAGQEPIDEDLYEELPADQ